MAQGEHCNSGYKHHKLPRIIPQADKEVCGGKRHLGQLIKEGGRVQREKEFLADEEAIRELGRRSYDTRDGSAVARTIYRCAQLAAERNIMLDSRRGECQKSTIVCQGSDQGVHTVLANDHPYTVTFTNSGFTCTCHARKNRKLFCRNGFIV